MHENALKKLPRSYVVVKDPSTKRTKCFTVPGQFEEVLEAMQQAAKPLVARHLPTTIQPETHATPAPGSLAGRRAAR